MQSNNNPHSDTAMNKTTTPTMIIYARTTPGGDDFGGITGQMAKVNQSLTDLGIDSTQAVQIADNGRFSNGLPGFRDLLSRLSGGGVTVLAVTGLSRLCRRRDLYPIVKPLLAAGGRFIAVADQIDSAEQGSAQFLATLEAEGEKLDGEISRKCHRIRSLLLAQGRVLRSELPYGYSSLKQGGVVRKSGLALDTEVIIAPDQAAVVRRVFDLFLDQKRRCDEIAATLNEEGVATGWREQFRPWRVQRIRTMLADRKYTGTWSGEYRRRGNRKHPVPNPNRERVQPVFMPHLQIVTQETFDAVTSLRMQKAHARGTFPPPRCMANTNCCPFLRCRHPKNGSTTSCADFCAIRQSSSEGTRPSCPNA